MTVQTSILAIGGAHIDRRGVASGPYIAGASNPGTMREEVGGGAFNGLRNAVRLGARGSMLSVRGGDLAGQLVETTIAAAGIADLSAVFLDRTTPSYTAILEESGELVCGFADMTLYDVAFQKQLRRHPFRGALPGCDGVLTDANLPTPALERLVRGIGDRPLFAIAISPAKIVRLMPVLPALTVLFMNRAEARALVGAGLDLDDTDLAGALVDAGLKRAVVTSGGNPVLLVENGQLARIAPPLIPHVRDVTGAGDALAGTAMLRMLQGMDLSQAVRHGIAAASLTIRSDNVVADFDEAALVKCLADVPEPVGA